MMPEHLFALIGIVQHDPLDSLLHPVQEKLSRSFADAILRWSNLDIIWGRGGKTKRLGLLGYYAYQEPAAGLEANRAQRASLGPLLERHLAIHLAVLDNLQKADWVAA